MPSSESTGWAAALALSTWSLKDFAFTTLVSVTLATPAASGFETLRSASLVAGAGFSVRLARPQPFRARAFLDRVRQYCSFRRKRTFILPIPLPRPKLYFLTYSYFPLSNDPQHVEAAPQAPRFRKATLGC